MKRLYKNIILDHIKKHRQMLFMMGPRQVGKTTLTLTLKDEWENLFYFNWDDGNQRESILAGPKEIALLIELTKQTEKKPIVIFDEIHKYSKWKLFLKGFYDTYPEQAHIIVTGSAKLDVFQKGGDSLMGRYFPFRIHPISVAEILHKTLPDQEIRQNPKKIDEDSFKKLWKFGGYPDPFIKGDIRFFNRWKRLRFQQLFREELRDISRVHELSQLETLAMILTNQTGQLITYSSLAKKIRVSDNTIRFWLEIFKSLFFCYEVKPWSRNVSRSLIKEPKYYLWDWTMCSDAGKKAENFIASHLLKAVHLWTDCGYGDYQLYFLRDKSKREVDFLITRDDHPWILVEAKLSLNKGISSSLEYFKSHLEIPFAFQVVIELPYVNKNCFESHEPTIVSARTFLSQLV